jgi:hypothetical protein
MKSKCFTISRVLLSFCLIASFLFSAVAIAQPLSSEREMQKMKEITNIDKAVILHSDGAQIIFNKENLAILTRVSTWRDIINTLNKNKLKSTELEINMKGLTSADLTKFLRLLINNNYASNIKTLMLMNMNTKQLNALLAKASFLTEIEYASCYGNYFINPEAMIAAFAQSNPNFHGIVGNTPLTQKLLSVYSKNPKLSVMGGVVNAQDAEGLVEWFNKNPSRIKILNIIFAKKNTLATDIKVLKALGSQTGIRLFSVNLLNGKVITPKLSDVLATTLSKLKDLHSFDLVGYTNAQTVASSIKELAAWQHREVDAYFNGTNFSKAPLLLTTLLSDNRIIKLSLRNAGLTNTHLPLLVNALKKRKRPVILVLTDNKLTQVVPFIPALKAGKVTSLYVSNISLGKNQLNEVNAQNISIYSHGKKERVVIGTDIADRGALIWRMYEDRVMNQSSQANNPAIEGGNQ